MITLVSEIKPIAIGSNDCTIRVFANHQPGKGQTILRSSLDGTTEPLVGSSVTLLSRTMYICGVLSRLEDIMASRDGQNMGRKKD